MLENRARRAGLRSLNFESLETRCLLSATSQIIAEPSLQISPMLATSSLQGLTPAQVRKAYGFDQISIGGVSGSGAGQTIAIVDAFNDPNIASDLTTFDKQFSLPDPVLKKVSQTGSSTALPSDDSGWSTEISLDVEWAHAIAPKANILLVETKSDSLTDLLAGIDYARNAAGVSVVSLSWGSSEFYQESQYDSHFTTPAGHTGVTFVAASGDEGSRFGPSWPATSSNVLAVGGTTLNIADSTGTYGSETAWSDSTGGFSQYEPEPAYQQIAQFSGGKSSPDVAYNANPDTGFAVYDSFADQGVSGWQVYGGTSAGTPQWAALIAIADQGRAQNGVGTLDGATGTLPTLYSLYTATNYFTNFHDETIGRSSFFTSARPGYDLITGLGSPQANQVVQVLINSTTGSSAAAQTKTAVKTVVRSQARRAVVVEVEPQTQQTTPTIANPLPQQPIIEVQTFATPTVRTNDIAPLVFETAGNMRNTGSGFNPFHRATDFATQKTNDAEALVGQFKFVHRPSSKIISSDGNENASMPDQAAAEGEMLAISDRVGDESTAWKQLAYIVGAGIVVGTYATKMRRPKRTSDI